MLRRELLERILDVLNDLAHDVAALRTDVDLLSSDLDELIAAVARVEHGG